jgi:chemotaxis family two-component system response regulator Rcp1
MSVSNPQPARILVIEDSRADIYLLRHALDQHSEPYELEVLRDGAEALKFIAAQRDRPEPRPCVIVLDLHLPKHDGVTVLEAIKRAPALLHIQVVALSSFASPHAEAEIRALGVRRYCEKPSELDAWIALAGDLFAICRETPHLSMA